MEEIRIAFLADNLGQGGAERQLFYIVKSLVEQGYFPDVYYFNSGGYWEEPLRTLGIRVVSIEMQSKLARLREFVKFISQGNYDYVHSQQFFTNLYAVAASLICNTHCIGSIRNNVISEVHSMGLMGWFSLILPAKMVANSRAGMENAKKYFRSSKDIYFLPNVVDIDVFFPNNFRSQKESFKVLTVGTIWKSKRIDRVIEIAELLKGGSHEKITFEIIGDGEQLEEMVALAKSKGLLNSLIFFMGRSNNIASIYREADILLLTSDFEGTPNVVLEAMSSGLPVIASRVGDVSNIIVDGETGFTFEREDLVGMASAIETLYEDTILYSAMSKKARAHVLDKFSPSQMAERLGKLYST